MHKKIIKSYKRIIGIDFFCGCGGMTHGLKKAGIDMLAGFDNDPDAKFPYERNNRGAKFYEIDIRKVKETVSLVKRIIASFRWDYLFFASCPPCQPFSLHNRNHKWDSRKGLMLKFVEVVKKLPRALRPTFIIAENVGAMKTRGRHTLSLVIKRLEKMNYVILPPKVVNAAYFGVPQKRRRLILIAVQKNSLLNKEKFDWKYFYSNYRTRLITVRQAISHLPKVKAGCINKKDPLHVTQSLSGKNLRRLKRITVDGGSRDMWHGKDTLKCYKEHDGHKDVYGRMKWDKPAPTLTCRCISISNGRFGHPKQNRAITLREAAILQTLDDYKFEVPIVKTKIARQIGNAVPPKLFQIITRFLLQQTKQISEPN